MKHPNRETNVFRKSAFDLLSLGIQPASSQMELQSALLDGASNCTSIRWWSKCRNRLLGIISLSYLKPA